MPTAVGILTVMSRKIAFQAYMILKNADCFIFSYLSAFKISCSTKLSMKKVFYLWALDATNDVSHSENGRKIGPFIHLLYY